MARTSCLVLAPHPDDETLGCGATIARKRAAGTDVLVVVATGGGGGAARPPLPDPRIPGPTTPRTAAPAGVRRRELRDACARLGVPPHRVLQLDHPDGSLADAHTAVVAELDDLLHAFRPDEVLVTWHRDPHDDHRALSAAVRAALTDHPDVQHLEYPVHAWIRGPWHERVAGHPAGALRRSLTERFTAPDARPVLGVQTGPFADAKRAAITAYRSQFADRAATWGALGPEFVAHFTRGREVFFPVERSPRTPTLEPPPNVTPPTSRTIT